MALIVEDGTGLTTAESYLSVADTDTYNTKYTASADWIAATNDEKERSLRVATQYIDLQYGGRWRGTRTNETQALDWPRADVEDDDGFEIDEDAIPTDLEHATAEAALRDIAGDDLLAIETEGDITADRIKVGPIEVDQEFSNPKPQQSTYPKIDRYLRSLTYPSVAIRA